MRRRLFWKIYLTILACLSAAVVAVVLAGRFVSVEGAAPWTARQARAVEALIPASDDPPGTVATALDRLASALDADVTVLSPDGRTVAEAGAALAPGRRVHSVALGDGRTVLLRFKGWSPAGGRAYVLPLVAAVIGLVAYPVVRRITRRLERVRAGMGEWGAGSLSTRVPACGRDEVAAVAAAFNAAADRVERLIAAHRSLLANASHELRSPLARLRVAIELGGRELPPDVHREVVQSLAELDDLVEEILLASRLDHGGSVKAWGEVDVLVLCAEEAARVGAEVGGVATPVAGDPRLLRRMVRNLFENARRHGVPPIEVEVIEADPSTIAVLVRDHGPGIPPAERTRVFEPFYRPAGRSEAAGSWGLGLSLVRKIAEGHGGSVRCEETPGGGATFVVTLPRVASLDRTS